MSSDVRDILDMEPLSTELTKEALMNSNKRKLMNDKVKAIKRPEGMHREVYALLYNDNKDAPPLIPTDTGSGYKQVKARLGMKKVRKWEWAPFQNPARTDSAVFHHWRRASDEPTEYLFAKFNRPLNIPTYTLTEYNLHLKTNTMKWSKAQTDHLFDLARRFDLRFVVMADRWQFDTYGHKTVEDLKERYYECLNALQKAQAVAAANAASGSSSAAIAAAAASSAGGTSAAAVSPVAVPPPKPYVFDAEHERKRKEQLRKLLDRTPQQVEEEQMLINELKKIEMRKKERDRKTQDLQKLISQADQQIETVQPTASSSRKQDNKKLNKKKLQSQNQRPSRLDSVVNAVESAGIKFNELRGSGVSLRSLRMKLPANVGQKKTKALEHVMAEFDISHLALSPESLPPPCEKVCVRYNELRSDMVLLGELRTALATISFEMESLKHQYEAACPGKSLGIPAVLQLEIAKATAADDA